MNFFGAKLIAVLLPVLVCVTGVASDSIAFNEKTGNLYFLLGVDAGLSLLNSSIAGEANKGGFGLNLKGGLSYYWSGVVLDGRFGWGINSVSGTRTDGTKITEKNGALFFEIVPRLRFGNEYQFGPVFEGRFGTDLSYKPTISPILAGEQEQDFAMFLGAEFLYETSNIKNPTRIGLRFVTDLNIPDRQFFAVQALLQVGFRLTSSPAPVEPMFVEERVEEPIDEFEPVTTQVTEEEVIENPEQFVDIPFLKLHFRTNSAKLQPTSFQLAERVAEFLARNKDSFSKAEIEGHTDDRGKYSYNMRLSQRRADTLRGILIAQGVPTRMIRTKGYGESKPIIRSQTTSARAKNRRVRLKLYDVTEPARFKKEIEQIRDLFSLRKPNRIKKRKYRKKKKFKRIRYRKTTYRKVRRSY